jgi:NAD(P)-dependent dehydrogenase (short-subunit alcohol dehydrogenase family)
MPASRTLSETALGEVGDVAEAVAYLASDAAGAVTGTNLIVAGTWKM